MKLNLPTDLDPRLAGPRPDEMPAPMAQPMPTLAEQGVRIRPMPVLPKPHRVR